MGGVRLVSNPILKRNSPHSSSNEAFRDKSQTFEQQPFNSGQVEFSPSQLPQFVRHEESTTIELFYDLFFVANLTTFTSVHEVNSRKALTSYIGFFCVLWFTWCQTSLYDVRFMADSWLERTAKACHLGVMVGLSIVGPNYDTESAKGKDNSKSLKVLALILMASRLVLAIQYSMTAFHLRTYRKTKLPVMLHVVTNVIAAIIYLIIAFALSRHERAYRAFYVVAVAEMVCIIAVSSIWKICSFKGTHLVERMSLLTLYILGEGVIDILKSTGKLAKVNNKDWSVSTIGTIIAAISAVYLLYMLYFDCLNHRHFGSIRQQIWSFAHFPFHAALVLAVTGMAQFVVWHKVVEAVFPLIDKFQNIYSDMPEMNSTLWTDTRFSDLGEQVGELVNKTLENYPIVYTATKDEIMKALDAVYYGFEVGNEISYNTYLEGLDDTVLSLSNSIYQTYGFEAGGTKNKSLDPEGEFIDSVYTLSTVFVYFFIAAGLTIVILGALSLIMDTHKSWRKGTILRFISHFIIGTTVALLSLCMQSNRASQLLISPWLIPIFTFSIAIVLAFHHIKWGKGDKEHDINEYAAPAHVQN